MKARWLKDKRWKKFFGNQLAMWSATFLIAMSLMSLTSEFWANNKPIVVKYNGTYYFPVAKTYHPSVFGREDIFVMDYRNIDLDEGNWAIWPMIRWDPYERNEQVETVPGPPSSSNWFGTDENGRDVASRLLYGYRYSMGYAVAVWVLCSLFGMLVGAIMGYRGGWTDLLGQRVIEVIECVPALMLLIIMGSIFRPNLTLLIIYTVVLGWTGISLYFRAEFLQLRKREFVEGARAMGARPWRIIFQHIGPNSLTPWISVSPFMIAGGVTGLAALDYLGYGLQAPTPSWGELLAQAQTNFRSAWWLALYPSLALFLTLTGLNFVGRALRDAFDPRS